MWTDGVIDVPAHDRGVNEIRAMVWDARVIEPTSSEDVTVVLRVTYHSIEAICGELYDVTESASPRLS
jgi:hypothetical protein